MAEQGSEGLLSSFLRTRRLNAALPYIRGSVLDFGCGGGALAQYCDADSYVGVDRSADALAAARASFPRHRFQEDLPNDEQFGTVVALALIEHLEKPDEWLLEMAGFVKPGGWLVLTTPHPAFRTIHDVGAHIGLFSREASEEHETFFRRDDLKKLAMQAGLSLFRYRRFLLGANQLAVLERQGG